MQLVALRDWYPQMADKWTGRRVSWEDRTHWVHHHTVGGTGVDPLTYARRVADQHWGQWGVPGGYGVLVGTDGVLRAMCGLDYQGVHAGTREWNRRGVGIAYQGDFRLSPPSGRMLNAARALIAAHPLDQTYHRAVRPEPTTCPGDALIALLPLEDSAMKPPTWARDATQWHIDNGIYSESSPDQVDESIEFHRQSVFRHRFYNAIRGEFGSGTHNHDGRYVKNVKVSK